MRILYWTPLFWPEIGGIETMARKMAIGLADRGHRMLVLASHGGTIQPDATRYHGIPVHRFHFWRALSRSDPGLIGAIRRQVAALIDEFQPDIVHYNFSGHTAYFQLAAAHRLPLLVALHSSLQGIQAGPETILRRLLRAADWVTAVSQATLADARAIVDEINVCSSVIYNGQTAADLPPAPLPWNDPRLLGIGRLTAEKGFDLAVAALKLLREGFPRLRLVLAGDGPERPRLAEQVLELGLAEVVTFTGSVSERSIPSLLNQATIVLIPSRCREAFSLVAVEAALMGRPVVASDAGGLRESVIDQQTGLLVEMENPSALAEAVGFLLKHQRQTVAMGRSARQRALAIFNFDDTLSAYEALYKRLVASDRRAVSAVMGS